jgi:hypothetical protein
MQDYTNTPEAEVEITTAAESTTETAVSAENQAEMNEDNREASSAVAPKRRGRPAGSVSSGVPKESKVKREGTLTKKAAKEQEKLNAALDMVKRQGFIVTELPKPLTNEQRIQTLEAEVEVLKTDLQSVINFIYALKNEGNFEKAAQSSNTVFSIVLKAEQVAVETAPVESTTTEA